jgi:glycosyltransferase involved in cell wall biosynthesis
VNNLLPALRDRGIECDVAQVPNSLAARFGLFRRCKWYDIVFLQRKLLPLPFFWCLRANSRFLVYDFDDAAVYREPADSRCSEVERYRSRTRARHFSRTIRGADLVIAGNQYLAGLVAEHGARGVEVEVLPTSIDIERWKPKVWEREVDGGVVLGWMGTKGNLRYVRPLAPVFGKLAARYPQVKLKLVCDAFVDIPGISMEKKIWNESEESDDARSFDIGLAPLPDNPWTRGKCGFKILTYSASAIPVVCSPVGANRDMVVEGESGFFASTESEWLEKLSLLIEDEGLRRRMGTKGREHVAANYSRDAAGLTMAELLKSAAHRGR